MKLLIIVGSTRQARATPRVAKWVEKTALASQPDHEWQYVDLIDYDLPFFDEPISPLGNTDRHPEGNVKRWLDTLADADGFVFVTPEYNHGMPAVLKNAIDYVDRQLKRKPVAIISHGVVGGVRSAEQLGQVLRSNVGATPIPETVYVSGHVGNGAMISEDGELLDDAVRRSQKPLENTLASLVWYADAFKAKR